MPDAHEPIRIVEGKWPQEHAVHDAEDRGIRSNTERERQNRDSGESGTPQKLANDGAEAADNHNL